MKTDFYRKYITTHYDNVNSSLQNSYDKRYLFWKSYIAELISKNRNIKILEIGSGMGHNLIALSRLGYKNLVGVDVSPECVNFCKSKKLNSILVKNDNSSFYEKNRETYDLVILYDVLEHFTPEAGADLIRKCRQVLRQKGNVLISVPNGEHPLNCKIMYADITHKFMYSESSLNQLLKNCGCTNIRTKQLNSFTTHDNNIFLGLFKRYLLRPLSFVGETWWKLMGITQGIIYGECKPTLLCICTK